MRLQRAGDRCLRWERSSALSISPTSKKPPRLTRVGTGGTVLEVASNHATVTHDDLFDPPTETDIHRISIELSGFSRIYGVYADAG
jgi:hypothetical protein